MMDYSSSRVLTSMHPSIRHLNIRNVAKIVTSKIILNTALQLQYNPDFCRQLGVSTYLGCVDTFSLKNSEVVKSNRQNQFYYSLCLVPC